MIRYAIVVAVLLAFTASAAARDIYVDNVAGLETNDGLAAQPGPNGRGPFKTIHRGLRTAVPGDTVHLAASNHLFLESAVFHDRECPADKPITLDGHGAIISGVERVDLAQWELVGPGLYRKTKLLKHCDAAVIGRYFFRINEQMQHMGRTSKGPSAKLKDPQDLRPGEWTFVVAEREAEGDAKNAYADGAFYVKLDPAKRPTDYMIEYPARSSGVQVSGRNENIVIRNLNIQHVYNDGFNIHGYSRGVRFENIKAVECGDDGISAHDDCRITVRKFESRGNSTGFCHTNESWSDSSDVLIAECFGFDVFVLGSGQHTLTDSIVESAASSCVVVLGSTDKTKPGPCRLEMKRVEIEQVGKNEQVKFLAGSIVKADECVFTGFHIDASGESLELTKSVILEENIWITLGLAPSKRTRILSVDPKTKFVGKGNIYELKQIRRGNERFTRETYQKEMPNFTDTGFRWLSEKERYEGRTPDKDKTSFDQ